MSEKETVLDPLYEHVAKQAEVETLKQKVLAEELIIRARNAENKLQKIKENDRNSEIAKTINYGLTSEEDIEKIQRENSNT